VARRSASAWTRTAITVLIWVWNRDGFAGLENNRWYCLEQHARLNTPGKNDGLLRGWVDG
jgi:hypothetical protein